MVAHKPMTPDELMDMMGTYVSCHLTTPDAAQAETQMEQHQSVIATMLSNIAQLMSDFERYGMPGTFVSDVSLSEPLSFLENIRFRGMYENVMLQPPYHEYKRNQTMAAADQEEQTHSDMYEIIMRSSHDVRLGHLFAKWAVDDFIVDRIRPEFHDLFKGAGRPVVEIFSEPDSKMHQFKELLNRRGVVQHVYETKLDEWARIIHSDPDAVEDVINPLARLDIDQIDAEDAYERHLKYLSDVVDQNKRDSTDEPENPDPPSFQKSRDDMFPGDKPSGDPFDPSKGWDLPGPN